MLQRQRKALEDDDHYGRSDPPVLRTSSSPSRHTTSHYQQPVLNTISSPSRHNATHYQQPVLTSSPGMTLDTGRRIWTIKCPVLHLCRLICTHTHSHTHTHEQNARIERHTKRKMNEHTQTNTHAGRQDQSAHQGLALKFRRVPKAKKDKDSSSRCGITYVSAFSTTCLLGILWCVLCFDVCDLTVTCAVRMTPTRREKGMRSSDPRCLTVPVLRARHVAMRTQMKARMTWRAGPGGLSMLQASLNAAAPIAKQGQRETRTGVLFGAGRSEGLGAVRGARCCRCRWQANEGRNAQAVKNTPSTSDSSLTHQYYVVVSSTMGLFLGWNAHLLVKESKIMQWEQLLVWSEPVKGCKVVRE